MNITEDSDVHRTFPQGSWLDNVEMIKIKESGVVIFYRNCLKPDIVKWEGGLPLLVGKFIKSRKMTFWLSQNNVFGIHGFLCIVKSLHIH